MAAVAATEPLKYRARALGGKPGLCNWVVETSKGADGPWRQLQFYSGKGAEEVAKGFVGAKLNETAHIEDEKVKHPDLVVTPAPPEALVFENEEESDFWKALFFEAMEIIKAHGVAGMFAPQSLRTDGAANLAKAAEITDAPKIATMMADEGLSAWRDRAVKLAHRVETEKEI
jgi:hypothetical protein